MDLNLFSTLIQNLLHLHVLYVSEDDENSREETTVFQEFQKQFCYHPVLQPAFTADVLTELRKKMEDHIFYYLEDELGICLVFFLLEEHVFLLGPFVHREADDAKIQAALMAHRFPASYGSSISVYYSAFPIAGTTHIHATVTAIIRSMTGRSEEYSFCPVSSSIVQKQTLPASPRENSLDYRSLYLRYDLENTFLHHIEMGDSENVLSSFQAMTMAGMGTARYINAVYQDPGIALAMIRAMARKAAERGGASIVEIHEITQRAVQKINNSRNAIEQTQFSNTMILELTEAVRRSRMTLGSYSAPIRKTIEYLQFNYSQKINLSDLSAISGFSASYLAKMFKHEVGKTIFQYIAWLRCTKAADMLRSGTSPIQEISSYVGYEDNNYFVKVFRKQFGMTPSEYRESSQARP